MKDKKGVKLHAGDDIWFYPAKGNGKREGVVKSLAADKELAVQLVGDPFMVKVPARQVEVRVATDLKELRKQAKSLGIDGWRDMSKAELQAAVDATEDETPQVKEVNKVVKKAKKGNKADKKDKTRPRGKGKETKAPKGKVKKDKKAAKAKKAKKAAAPADPRSPYRPGSNMALIADAIRKGGKRSTMIEDLRKVLNLNPRTREMPDGTSKGSKHEQDTVTINGRIMLVARQLKDEHGWKITTDGKGLDSTIKGKPPKG